jgi:hypothetical protein
MWSFSKLQKGGRGKRSPIPDKYPLFDLLRKKSKSERGKLSRTKLGLLSGIGDRPAALPLLVLEIASA